MSDYYGRGEECLIEMLRHMKELEDSVQCRRMTAEERSEWLWLSFNWAVMVYVVREGRHL